MKYDENLCRLCLQIEVNHERKPLSINIINALKDIFKIRVQILTNRMFFALFKNLMTFADIRRQTGPAKTFVLTMY